MLAFKQKSECKKFKMFYSSLRTVDSLKLRILHILRDQLQIPKLSCTKIKVFSVVKGLNKCIDNVGHCLV